MTPAIVPRCGGFVTFPRGIYEVILRVYFEEEILIGGLAIGGRISLVWLVHLVYEKMNILVKHRENEIMRIFDYIVYREFVLFLREGSRSRERKFSHSSIFGEIVLAVIFFSTKCERGIDKI